MNLLAIKWGGIAAALLVLCVTMYHLGGNPCRAAAARAQEAQSEAIATAVLAERAAQAATAAADRAVETQHAKDLAAIDTAPVRVDPIFVCNPAAPIHQRPLPGPQAPADRLATDPAGRGSEPDGGDRDIRPGVEALKRKLEKIMADYRQLAAEWPQ